MLLLVPTNALDRMTKDVYKRVLDQRAVNALERMKSIAFQSSQEPVVDTNIFSYPRVKSPETNTLVSSNGRVRDIGDKEDTEPQAAVTPASLSQSIGSNVPTLLTTGGRRSFSMSANSSKPEISSISSSVMSQGYLGNVDALVNTNGSSPSVNGARSIGEVPLTTEGGVTSQRSSDAAITMLAMRDTPSEKKYFAIKGQH